MTESSTANRSLCCERGMVFELLQLFPKLTHEPVFVLLLKVVELLGAHSISVRELKRLFQLLRSSSNHARPKFWLDLVRALQRMTRRPFEGPSVFFDFDSSHSRLLLPALRKWPDPRGFSWCTWLRAESLGSPSSTTVDASLDVAQQGHCRLFSFLTTKSGGDQQAATTVVQGLECGLASDGSIRCFSYSSHGNRMCRTEAGLIRVGTWHFVGVTLTNQERVPWAKSECKVYVDGVKVVSDPFKFVSFPRLDRCCIGSNIQLGRDAPFGLHCANPFNGQIGTIYMFEAALPSPEMLSIYHLGSNYAGIFADLGGASGPVPDLGGGTGGAAAGGGGGGGNNSNTNNNNKNNNLFSGGGVHGNSDGSDRLTDNSSASAGGRQNRREYDSDRVQRPGFEVTEDQLQVAKQRVVACYHSRGIGKERGKEEAEQHAPLSSGGQSDSASSSSSSRSSLTASNAGSSDSSNIATSSKTVLHVMRCVDQTSENKPPERALHAMAENVDSCITRDPRDIIHSIGGLRVLFPLIQQLNQPVEGEPVVPPVVGVAEFGNREARSCIEVLSLLSDMLSESRFNQREMKKIGGFVTLAYLLQRMDPNAISLGTLQVIRQLMLSLNIQRTRELLDSALSALFLDFRLWIYTPFAVQKRLLEYVIGFVKKDGLLMKTVFSVKALLDSIRMFYYPEGERDSCLPQDSASAMVINANDPAAAHEWPAVQQQQHHLLSQTSGSSYGRPNEADVEVLRHIIYQIIVDHFSASRSVDSLECCALYEFAFLSKRPQLVIEGLTLSLMVLRSPAGPAYLDQILSLGGASLYLPLVCWPNHRICSLALRLIQLIQRGALGVDSATFDTDQHQQLPSPTPQQSTAGPVTGGAQSSITNRNDKESAAALALANSLDFNMPVVGAGSPGPSGLSSSSSASTTKRKLRSPASVAAVRKLTPRTPTFPVPPSTGSSGPLSGSGGVSAGDQGSAVDVGVPLSHAVQRLKLLAKKGVFPLLSEAPPSTDLADALRRCLLLHLRDHTVWTMILSLLIGREELTDEELLVHGLSLTEPHSLRWPFLMPTLLELLHLAPTTAETADQKAKVLQNVYILLARSEANCNTLLTLAHNKGVVWQAWILPLCSGSFSGDDAGDGAAAKAGSTSDRDSPPPPPVYYDVALNILKTLIAHSLRAGWRVVDETYAVAKILAQQFQLSMDPSLIMRELFMRLFADAKGELGTGSSTESTSASGSPSAAATAVAVAGTTTAATPGRRNTVTASFPAGPGITNLLSACSLADELLTERMHAGMEKMDPADYPSAAHVLVKPWRDFQLGAELIGVLAGLRVLSSIDPASPCGKDRSRIGGPRRIAIRVMLQLLVHFVSVSDSRSVSLYSNRLSDCLSRELAIAGTPASSSSSSSSSSSAPCVESQGPCQLLLSVLAFVLPCLEHAIDRGQDQIIITLTLLTRTILSAGHLHWEAQKQHQQQQIATAGIEEQQDQSPFEFTGAPVQGFTRTESGARLLQNAQRALAARWQWEQETDQGVRDRHKELMSEQSRRMQHWLAEQRLADDARSGCVASASVGVATLAGELAINAATAAPGAATATAAPDKDRERGAAVADVADGVSGQSRPVLQCLVEPAVERGTPWNRYSPHTLAAELHCVRMQYELVARPGALAPYLFSSLRDAVVPYWSRLGERSAVAQRLWTRILRSVSNERGAWAPADAEQKAKQTKWKLDKTENFSRMRLKLKVNYKHRTYAQCAQDQTSDPNSSPSGAGATDGDQLTGSETAAASLLATTTTASATATDGVAAAGGEDFGQGHRPESPLMTAAAAAASDAAATSFDSTSLAEQDNRLVFATPCELITPMRAVPGSLEIFTLYILFTETLSRAEGYDNDNDDDSITAGTGIANNSGDDNDLSSDGGGINGRPRKERKWLVKDIREVHLRRYVLRQSALEIFLTDKTNHMLNFTKRTRSRVYRAIIGLRPPNLGYSENRSPEEILRKSGLTRQWQKRQISNFDYLMQLNTIAGRTYNDLTQYPVFPWVLADYASDTIDLSDPQSFRDLSKPVGALTQQRLDYFIERYESFESDIPKFHYGSHYSSAGTVIFYLIRVEPFTKFAVELQGGQFDKPDRLFDSVPQTFENCMTSMSDVKELIPEFFYLPEMFVNQNQFHFGRKQNGRLVNDVALPPWAKGSAHEFVRIHRAALESEYVSLNLHKWIDLIFGFKQRGREAEKAANVFYFLTYEGAVDLDKIEDETERKATETQINNFGQTPTQLLKKPHPAREARPFPLSLFAASTATSTGAPQSVPRSALSAFVVQIAPKSVALLHIGLPPSVFTQGSAAAVASLGGLDRIVTVDARRVPSVHRWQPSTPTTRTPFTFEPDALLAARRALTMLDTKTLTARSFAVTSDGRALISCSHWDNSIKVSLLDTGRTVQSVRHHKDVVTCLQLTLDGRYLVSGSVDTMVIVWDVHGRVIDDKPRHLLYGHDDAVTCVEVSAELDLIVSGSLDGTVILHSLRSGEYVRSLRHPRSLPVHLLALGQSEGKIVVYSRADLQLRVYSVNLDEIVTVNCNERLTEMIIENEDFLICGGALGVLSARSLHDLSLVYKSNVESKITCLCRDDRFCFVGTSDGTLIILCRKE